MSWIEENAERMYPDSDITYGAGAVREAYAYGANEALKRLAQPEVNRFDPRVLNRKGWTCGCEPGNYDSCDECQSACNELADFLNRPEVNDGR